jgi:hypothetical protein
MFFVHFFIWVYAGRFSCASRKWSKEGPNLITDCRDLDRHFFRVCLATTWLHPRLHLVLILLDCPPNDRFWSNLRRQPAVNALLLAPSRAPVTKYCSSKTSSLLSFLDRPCQASWSMCRLWLVGNTPVLFTMSLDLNWKAVLPTAALHSIAWIWQYCELYIWCLLPERHATFESFLTICLHICKICHMLRTSPHLCRFVIDMHQHPIKYIPSNLISVTLKEDSFLSTLHS